MIALPGLATARLALAPAMLRDVDTLWAIWRQPEVRRYLFDDIPVSRERAEEAFAERVPAGADDVGMWIARPHGVPDAVGTVGLLRVTSPGVSDAPGGSDARAVDVLAAFDPGVWGRGYATESLTAVIDYAFATLRRSRVTAVVDVPNDASHRLVARLGFTATGTGEGPRYRFTSYVLTPAAFAMRSRYR
jgi:ribosomal-protein-alanine N-acetyltransferase